MTTFTTTRPTLATELMEAGNTARIHTNAFDPNKKAWTFTLTWDMVNQVKEYYKTKLPGKPLPKIIAYSIAAGEVARR